MVWGRVSVKVAGYVRAIPYKYFVVRCEWGKEKDAITSKDAVGRVELGLCRKVGDGEAIRSNVLEGGDRGVAVNHDVVSGEGVVGQCNCM